MSGVLSGHFTNSNILEFVSRHNADFSARTIFSGDFEARFTFSNILDFVKFICRLTVIG